MREILFRGKSVNHGCWEFGDLITSFGKTYIGNTVGNNREDLCEVYPETVGQFTGLLDKNEKKIFEGDVLKIYGINKSWADVNFELRFFKGNYCLFDPEINHRYMSLGYFFNKGVENGYFNEDCMCVDGSLFEIIGNIHDNPELIGK